MDTTKIVPTVRIQSEDFNAENEINQLKSSFSDIGAIATFIGVCRNESESLKALELEHYPDMAIKELTRIAALAIERWPLCGISIVHRYGFIIPGENIVFVASASKHRQPAFASAEFVMDYLKSLAPFWKKEHYLDGTSSTWVASRTEDDDAKNRWNESS